MSRDLSNMSPDEMLVLSGHFKSSTDAAAARIQEILTTIREKSLKDEDGIKLYHISRFKRSIMLLAEYENVATFKKHMKLHPFQAYFKEGSDGLLAEPFSLLYYQEIP